MEYSHEKSILNKERFKYLRKMDLKKVFNVAEPEPEFRQMDEKPFSLLANGRLASSPQNTTS